ncbi:Shedu immune nuclease family protein [Corynebacterium halotolerans]|uniref:Shedu immune nuclease family protein n=1 Tax=Corynebacterium halotolerans TaxID=225326 RepID=UPI003CEACBB9
MKINLEHLLEFAKPNEVTWATGRLTTRTYVSRSFDMTYGQDAGQRARYIHKVFDEAPTDDNDDWDWTKHVVYKTPGGRKQIELNVARSAGAVRKIRIQKVPTSGDLTKLEPVLELDRDQSTRLIDLIKALDSIPIEGDSTTYVDDQVLCDFFSDPGAMGRAYAQEPERFRALIQSDADARDVIALQHRRDVVKKMRTWLEDDAAFDVEKDQAGGPEHAWQQLLEENPWILGIGLSGQLVTSWDKDKLEKVVVGRDIQTVGKRVDALLRTNGIVRSLAFAEIKHHRTELLAEEYRSGVWRPSNDLTGAVTQTQQTVRMAVRDLGDYIEERAEDGSRTGNGTFIVRPRSFLIVGSLDQLLGKKGGPIDDKVHSFELFRRNLHEPEILTFDELVARAEWHVKLAEKQTARDDDEALRDDESL